MPAYLFQIDLSEITEEFESTIPVHRQYVNKLFSTGTLLSYSVSLQRHAIWCVVSAETEQHAMDYVVAFPLYRFFADVVCNHLLFHHTQSVLLPDISLN
jgi:hypothetical protein